MQVFPTKENLGKLTKVGNTSVQLSSSKITIGARQYSTSVLTCDITVSGLGGLGGLDMGAEQAGKYYYVYAVVNSGSISLICSLSATAPVGYSVNKKVGAFVNDFNGDVEQVLSVGEQPDSILELTDPIGVGSTNDRTLRFGTLFLQRGLEITWEQDSVLADRIRLNRTGVYRGRGSLADTAGSAQEIGLSINTDAEGNLAFGAIFSPAPEKRFASTRSSATNNHASHFSNERLMQANDYLKAHLQNAGTASLITENYVNIFKKRSDEIDWTQY